ncbi:MAG: DUF2304 domain-containing protein [Candidatus Woesearchaeota archaeon]|nr:DUF2304 domain-containing protein [Candidatus Woesearchaeota archaeon]
MLELLQVAGIGYILFMLYLSFLYYKQNNYSLRSFLFWVTVWLGGILLLLVPETTSFFTQRLQVARTIDFYLILGLMFFSVITFFNYVTVKKTERRVEELVRKTALKKK